MSIQYHLQTAKYWSTALRDVDPACIVLPTSAAQVSSVVQVLNRYPDVEFAVKSGGHDPNVGHATVQDGVLIAFHDLVGATYDAEANLAHVKPGGEWNDVIGDLEPSGVTIVGGRLGLVGVGGYLLQGGISFLSAQYGLAADPPTKNAHQGIITEFVVEAHPIGKVWGGFRFYTSLEEEAIYAALHDFVPGGAEDPKAAIILTSLIALGSTESFAIFYFYDGPEPPTSGPFAKFLDIPALLDVTYAQSNGAAAELLNSRVSFRHIDHLTAQCSADFQPFPSIIGQHSQDKGGNAMGLSGSDPDRLILELQCSWSDSDDDEVLYEMSRQMTDWLEEKVPEWLAAADEPVDGVYLPLFMNDAMGDQNVTGSYRDYAKFKALQQSVDPDGLFSARSGGYKY
ncbi:putative fad dependent protein [Eutypa lata UCREL1]|uniref:Putative fad dependent protein n=1 Tax=Eutypa lata (strain UCR-EL1) TaxID=1287681 RepID=M7T779_EUTLA|nr:putative fad dependent protein [Eutypa lata UCREL1]